MELIVYNILEKQKDLCTIIFLDHHQSKTIKQLLPSVTLFGNCSI